MDAFILLGAAVFGALLFLAFRFGSRWNGLLWGRHMTIPEGSQQPSQKPAVSHLPESSFKVTFNDQEIVCTRPDGTQERVTWQDLQKIEIMNTGEGPFSPDCFWLLHGTENGCVIPQGATGDAELLERLQALPEFDNTTFIEAMGSIFKKRFVCWVRPGLTPTDNQS